MPSLLPHHGGISKVEIGLFPPFDMPFRFLNGQMNSAKVCYNQCVKSARKTPALLLLFFNSRTFNLGLGVSVRDLKTDGAQLLLTSFNTFLKLFLPIFALSKLHKNCVQNFFDNLINKLYRFEPVARTLNLGRTMSTMPTQNLMSLKKIVAEKCLWNIYQEMHNLPFLPCDHDLLLDQ